MKLIFNPLTGKFDYIDGMLTSGQTINVSTAAELTTALANLAAAPSLLGNVIISLAAGNYTGNWTIPKLIYNGFTLTIEGTLTELLSTTATGGATCGTNDTWTGNTPAYFEKIAAGWTVDAYKNKLLWCDLGIYGTNKKVPIISNSATQIKYSCHSAYFPVSVNGTPFKVYDWATKIYPLVNNNATHTFVADDASVIFKNLWIESGNANCAIRSTSHGQVDLYCCYLIGTWSGATVRAEMGSLYRIYSCIIKGNAALRIETHSACLNYVMPDGSHGGLHALSNGSNAIFVVGNSYFQTVFGAYISGESVVNSNGFNTTYGKAAILHSFIWNCPGTGVLATAGGVVTLTSLSGFTNNGTDKNPAAAADPSYIS